MLSNEIIEVKDPSWFKEYLKEKEIKVSPHARDRLNHVERDIFTEEDLKRPLERDTPNFVALQRNGRYTVYYKRKEGYLNIIIEKTGEESIEIISFMKKRVILPIPRK